MNTPASLDFHLSPETTITHVQGAWSGYLTLETPAARLHIHVRDTEAGDAARVLAHLATEATALAARFAQQASAGVGA